MATLGGIAGRLGVPFGDVIPRAEPFVAIVTAMLAVLRLLSSSHV